MRSGQQGFTLMEIMVVMVILSFGLVAVVGAVAQAARSTSAIEELESLRQAAEQVLATQVIQAQMPSERSEGSLGRINWELNVSDDPEFVNLKQLRITTFIAGKPDGRRFTVESRQALLGSSAEDTL
ncbi:MAG: prepilin-type N-terminal cleavage/methylation domain-containing protein [Arenicellales bacterium]|jgi:prepilin-type N-terminal cleavage/methylation domain-containing protein|nr:prepilin-type N-terminal cleavage/methylation domain-containing protein [Arenicellales bacterium]